MKIKCYLGFHDWETEYVKGSYTVVSFLIKEELLYLVERHRICKHCKKFNRKAISNQLTNLGAIGLIEKLTEKEQ